MSGVVCPGHSGATVPTQISTLCVDQFPPFEAVLGATVINRDEQITKSFLIAPSNQRQGQDSRASSPRVLVFFFFLALVKPVRVESRAG